MVDEILRVGVALRRCLCEIAQSFFTVRLHLLSQQIELSQRVLGKRIPLCGRVLQKLNGRIYILWHTFRAGEQQLAEPVLCVWIVLLRCLPQPVKGLRELLPLQQQFAQRVCGARITGLRRFLKPLCRRFSVNRYAKPVLICLSQLVCRDGIALLPQTAEGDPCRGFLTGVRLQVVQHLFCPAVRLCLLMDYPLRTWIWRNRRFFRLWLILHGIILEGEVHFREPERFPDNHVAHSLELLLLRQRYSLRRCLIIVSAKLLSEILP